MFASMSAELFKLRKRPATWLITAVWLVLSLVFGYAFPYFGYTGGFQATPGSPDPERVLAEALPAGLVPAAIQGFPMFAGALALILGALCAGSEYQWHTVKTVFAQGPPRWALFAGKVGALGLATWLLVIATFVVDAGAATLVATSTDHPMEWPGPAEIGRGVLGGWLIVLMWCSGGVFLGTVLRGNALAIGVGLVWALAVENLVRLFSAILGPLEVVQRWMPGTNAGALTAVLGVPAQGQVGGTPGTTTVVGGTHAVTVLVAYIAVFVVASTVVLTRRDVT